MVQWFLLFISRFYTTFVVRTHMHEIFVILKMASPR
uniref:Uncharacterized protein n=1 Tax=Setaria viridis TaxID=4556 RepID=A0A4U6VW46_SETVI|nr:hypothetical protein SEVIR_2G208250v2 [Setaria viridis]